MTRPRAVPAWCAAVGVVLVLIFLAARCSWSPGSYPASPQGWSQRWNDAAQEFGRTPGEGWDIWIDVAPDLETATTPDEVGVLLDRLVSVERFTVPTPASIGSEVAYDETTWHLRNMRGLIQEFVIPGISDALDTQDTDAAAGWIDRAWALARVIEAAGSIGSGVIQAQLITRVLDAAGDQTGVIAATDDERITELLSAAPLPDIAWSLRMERELGLATIVEWMADRSLLVSGDQPAIYERLLQDWVAYERDGDHAAGDRARRIMDRLENDRIFSVRRPMLGMLAPAMERAILHHTAARVRRDGLLVMIALERHRIDHGAYPDTLEALTPRYLRAVPEDPYADGRPLSYRVIPPSSSDPSGGYLLYSFGANGADNGGTTDAFHPDGGLTSPGYQGDFVFRQPLIPVSAGAGAP